MRKNFHFVALIVLAVASFTRTAEVVAAPLLAVDFGRSTPTPVQPGFSGMAGAAVEASRTEPFGPYTVTVQGEGF